MDTSRPRNDEDTNEKYNFVTRDQIQSGIKAKEYLEHGEYNGNLYGVRFKSITDVIAQNRIVVLDVNPWVRDRLIIFCLLFSIRLCGT